MHSLAIFVWLLLVVEPGFGANLRKPRESADHSWFQQYMDIIIDPFNPGAPKTQELDWFMRESNETDSEWPPKISLRDLLYYDADESDRKVIRASNLTDDYYSVNQVSLSNSNRMFFREIHLIIKDLRVVESCSL